MAPAIVHGSMFVPDARGTTSSEACCFPYARACSLNIASVHTSTPSFNPSTSATPKPEASPAYHSLSNHPGSFGKYCFRWSARTILLQHERFIRQPFAVPHGPGGNNGGDIKINQPLKPLLMFGGGGVRLSLRKEIGGG